MVPVSMVLGLKLLPEVREVIVNRSIEVFIGISILIVFSMASYVLFTGANPVIADAVQQIYK